MSQNGDSSPPPAVQESTIRKMTRLAIEHGAVNLSQGFPNEAPPEKVRLALAYGVLAGRPLNDTTKQMNDQDELRQSILNLLQQQFRPSSESDDQQDRHPHIDVVAADELNQYSPPMGRNDLREAVVAHYERLYEYSDITAEHNVTITLGATEAVASALRSVGRPGDKVVVFEPFHELYPSQCRIFYLEPTYVTLLPERDSGKWTFDREELVAALADARILLLNSPHNPTGKVFTHEELEFIVNLCVKYNVYIVTDEIYEHMCYHDTHHILIPKEFPQAKEITLVCNSLGKSASATGWRVGWCLHPNHLCATYRGIHDQLAVMAPHPMQYACITYLSLPNAYFSKELPTRYYDRLFGLAKILTEVGFEVMPPEGAYYLFADYQQVASLKALEPMESAMYLIREVGVACVPGDNFYGKAMEEGKKFLRFAACRSVEDLTKASEKLRAMANII